MCGLPRSSPCEASLPALSGRGLRQSGVGRVPAFLALGCVVVLGLPVMVPSAGVAADAECQREVVLGKSGLGSPIVACQLRGSDPAVKRPLLVVGSMHGTETAGMDVVSRLTQRDVTGLGANVWVVRTVNPDGVAAGSRGNARGVDVDGNFPTAGWKQRATGTADWGGPKASSEPETRALMKAVSKLRPKQAVVFHQDLGLISCPPYRSKSLAKRLHALTGYPYKCLPVLAGSFTAWANQQYSSTTALTFDLEASPPAERLDGVAAALVTLASTSPGPPSGAGTPTAPTAGADTGAVVRGQSVTIDVLANDRGTNGDLVAPGLAVITAPQQRSGRGPGRRRAGADTTSGHLHALPRRPCHRLVHLPTHRGRSDRRRVGHPVGRERRPHRGRRLRQGSLQCRRGHPGARPGQRRRPRRWDVGDRRGRGTRARHGVPQRGARSPTTRPMATSVRMASPTASPTGRARPRRHG